MKMANILADVSIIADMVDGTNFLFRSLCIKSVFVSLHRLDISLNSMFWKFSYIRTSGVNNVAKMLLI